MRLFLLGIAVWWTIIGYEHFINGNSIRLLFVGLGVIMILLFFGMTFPSFAEAMEESDIEKSSGGGSRKSGKWANNSFGKWSGGGRNKNRSWK